MDTELNQAANNSAKFAFFYMLSLVALVFYAIAVATVAFQVVNKQVVDLIQPYDGRFSPEALKFAIASIIIASPVYYLTTWLINKNLASGKLSKESGVRKWLTYFILLVSSVTMLGWLIGTLFNFLDGELTLKFVLKAASAILVAAVVFNYYFYDIRRAEVTAKNKVVWAFFIGSLIVAVTALATAFFFVPSPSETRAKKQDNETLNRFNMIDGGLNMYYAEKKKLPESLEELTSDRKFLVDRYIKDAVTGAEFGYKVLSDKKSYELCATFQSSNLTDDGSMDEYTKDRWPHDAGYQCISQSVFTQTDAKGGVVPTPAVPRAID